MKEKNDYSLIGSSGSLQTRRNHSGSDISSLKTANTTQSSSYGETMTLQTLVQCLEANTLKSLTIPHGFKIIVDYDSEDSEA